MRKLNLLFLITLLTLLISAPKETQAQTQFNFEYVTMGQGQSPVADGLNFSAAASHGNNSLLASFGTINAYSIYQWNDFLGVKGLSAGPSGGFFSGVPWVGPIVTYSPTSFISFMGWVGPSAGDAVAGKFDLTNIELAFVQADVKLSFTDNLHVGFSYLEFGGESYLPYVGGSVPLGNTMALFGSATYDIENEKPMFFMGFLLGF